MKSVRVFLSSTFLDFSWEREVINNVIAPDVNAQLRKRGRHVELIDLRWGVPDEAGLEHAAVDICLGEVRRCCDGPGRPAFILLQGDRAGWRPLPRVIGAEAFEALARTLEKTSSLAAADLRCWYTLDENFLPRAYALRSRRNRPEAEPRAWSALESRIREAVEKSPRALDPAIVRAFTTPITRMEMEVACALARGKVGVIAAMRRIAQDRKSMGLLGRLFGKSTASADGDDAEQTYLSTLATQAGVEEAILKRKDGEDEAYEAQFTAWAKEVLLRAAETDNSALQHGAVASLMRQRAETIERRAEGELAQWLDQPDGGVRLLFGVSGSGKTVLAKRAAAAHQRASGAVAALYLGESETALDTAAFLARAAGAFAPALDAVGVQPAALIAGLQSSLATNKTGPTLLVADALEQVTWRDASEALSWLPLRFGAGQKILLTTSDREICAVFQDLFATESMLDLGEMDDDETSGQISAELRVRGRTLTPAQYSAITRSTATTPGRALVNRIAAAAAQRMASDGPASGFPDTLDGWIKAWIKELAEGEGHGAALVTESLGLACAARRAAPEREMFEVLRTSESALLWLHAAFPFSPRAKELPRTMFSRLIAGLESLLDTALVDGEMCFELAHQGLRAGVAAALPATAIKAAHRSLAERYLAGLVDGAYASASPHVLSEVLYQQIRIGADAAPAIERLAANIDFIAAKTAPACLTDSIEEVSLLRTVDWLHSEIIREYCSLLVQERAALQALPDFAERRAYVQQAIDVMLRSNPLRNAALPAASGAANGGLVRQWFAMPRLPGITRIDLRASGSHYLILPFADELAIGQKDGSIAVVGATYGEERRRLPGHPKGPYSGGRLDAKRLADNRLLSWGADGEIAVSSVAAGRDILRMRTSAEHGVEYADQTAAGGFVASSHGANRIYRWDASGAPHGEIDVLAAEAPSFAITEAGLQESPGVRRDLYLPMTSGGANDLMPAFRSFFLTLSHDRVATGGMGSAAIWSFTKGGPVLILNQILSQEWSPKFLLPAGDNLIIVTNNGGVVRLIVDERRIEVIQRSGRSRGGADPLDEARMFCWLLREDGILQATIIDQRSGAVLARHELKADNIERMQYFRGGASNVPRGLFVLAHGVIGWSGYGCESIDLEAGWITPLNSWDFGQYATSAAKISETSFMLVKAGRPTIYSPADSGMRDFTVLAGAFDDVRDLGGGRVLAFSERGGGFFWDVRESLAWAERQDWGEFGRQPRDVIDARALPGGQTAIQHRIAGDDSWEFEFWGLHERSAALAGRARGARRFFQERTQGESHCVPIGPLLVTWGGPPPTVEIGAAPQETLFSHAFDGAKPLRLCVPLIDADGAGPFAVSALACADEDALRIVCTESGAMWTLPTPGEAPLEGMFLVDRDLVVASKTGAWRAVFASRTPRDPRFVALADAAQFAEPGRKVECCDIAHLGSSRTGLALFRVTPEKDGEAQAEAQDRTLIVAVYDLDKGVIAQERLLDATLVERDAAGFVLGFADGARAHIGFDAASGRVEKRVMAPDEAIVLAPRADAPGVRAMDRLVRSVQPLASPREGARFTIQAGQCRIVFEPDRILVRDGAREEAWTAPDGYTLLDFDAAYNRAYVLANRGAFQALDFALAEAPAALPVELNKLLAAAPSYGLLRLVRRCGRPDASAQAAIYWLSRSQQESDRKLEPALAALMYLELAEAGLALGDARLAGSAGAEVQKIILARAGQASDSESIVLGLGLSLVSVKLGILSGDFAGLRAQLFPAQERGEAAAQAHKARLWIDSSLALFRTDPERVALLNRCKREMEQAFAEMGLLQREAFARAGLEDLDALLKLSLAAESEDLSAVDWAAVVGPQHTDLLARGERGDAGALLEIGVMFGIGQGVGRTPLHAKYWYERASDAGNATAAMNLAQMYRHGEGVSKSPDRSFAYTKLAAERGLTPAKCNLGAMLMRGEGCAADPIAARAWLQQAADEGDDIAPISLAALYASGQCGPPDLDRARECLAPLVARGNAKAMQLLSMINRS